MSATCRNHRSIRSRTEIRILFMCSKVDTSDQESRQGGPVPEKTRGRGFRKRLWTVRMGSRPGPEFGIELRLRAIRGSAHAFADCKPIMMSPSLVRHTSLNNKLMAVLGPRCKHSLRRYNKLDGPQVPQSRITRLKRRALVIQNLQRCACFPPWQLNGRDPPCLGVQVHPYNEHMIGSPPNPRMNTLLDVSHKCCMGVQSKSR